VTFIVSEPMSSSGLVVIPTSACSGPSTVAVSKVFLKRCYRAVVREDGLVVRPTRSNIVQHALPASRAPRGPSSTTAQHDVVDHSVRPLPAEEDAEVDGVWQCDRCDYDELGDAADTAVADPGRPVTPTPPLTILDGDVGLWASTAKSRACNAKAAGASATPRELLLR